MTYKIKIRSLLKEDNMINYAAWKQYESLLMALLNKGIDFRLYADTEDREHITIVTR